MKMIKNVMWFIEADQSRILGIVQVETEYDGIKYYIGTACGKHESDDEYHISKYGAKFPKKVGDKLFKIK